MTSLNETRTAMLTKLAESGLDSDDAKKLGMFPKVNGEARDLTGYETPGFQITYFDIHGKPTGFWRYRNFGKTKAKYVQGKDTGVAVYFPPIAGADWAARITDATKPVFITEGELKAACATKAGFATLGLGGVYSFQSKKNKQQLIPDLEQFEWRNRRTYICYDSDAKTNAKVMAAESALAEQLNKLGANIYIIRLPSITKGGKTGLDDFLMHPKGGVKRFHKLIAHAEEWAKSGALIKFNQEVVFVKDPGVCVVRSTGQRIDPSALVHSAYSNWLYMKPTPTDKDALKRTEASVPAEWMKWPERAEVARMTYKPGKPKIHQTSDGVEYNMWIAMGSTPKRGNIQPWRTLLDFIFKDAKPADRKWFEQWCAFPIQNLGTKLYTAVVLWSSEQGTGKTLIGYTLGRIYGRNYQEISDQHLSSSFNDYMVNKQFILGDEITGTGTGEKRSIANKMKGMITQQEVMVNQKYVPGYTVPDCVNYLFTSNHCDAFFMEGSDRRYFVIEIKGKPLPYEFYADYDKWYKSEAGIAALHHHLMQLDTTGFTPTMHAPMTESKAAMISDGRSDMADWVHNVHEMQQSKKLMTSEELLLLATGQGKMNWTKNGITRAMKEAGYIQPLGATQQLALPEGKQVRPWLLDKEMDVPAKITQSWMRDLWYSDRQPINRTKKFAGGGK